MQSVASISGSQKAAVLALALACDPAQPAAQVTAPAQLKTETAAPKRAPLHPAAAFWGELEPGPFGMGFELQVLEDVARRGPAGSPDGALGPRPVLWALWYPTESPQGEPLRWKDYVQPELAAEPEATKAFVERLRLHTLGVAAEVVFRRPALPGKDTWHTLGAGQVAALEEQLRTPVPSYRGAAPTSQQRPAIIYHPGAGGSFEENAVLFEYLASHGYVVLSSAYPSDARRNPSTEWTQFTDSFADIQFLWRALVRRPDVDPSKVALMGHSLGAQTVYAYALAHRGTVALVSLDTTFENQTAADRDEASDLVYYANPGRLQTPVANFYANAEPNLSFVESLRGSSRRLVRIPEFGHEDFTSLGGVVRAQLEAEAGDSSESRARAQQAFRDYQSMCEEVRMFLDERLLGADPSKATANFERRTLARALDSDTSVERMVGELEAAGPAGVAEFFEGSCQNRACRELLPRALEELSLGANAELAQAVLAYVGAPERRDEPANFETYLIGARLSMRHGEWQAAVDYLERALAQLDKAPHANRFLQEYFVRAADEQLVFARKRLASADGTQGGGLGNEG